ncbi:MAG: glycerol-3-phosphate acyltransferase [Deltaproteobacteria bacterium]|nr:glycerol-3-phosphate acyltransferase [Deltaproteobacteria bacterium]MBN2670891.1 glycerol-3-phosphate acyltransferase [Deltaproteobacteria bacterium]
MQPLTENSIVVLSLIYIASYLIGSINFSILASAILLHRDIRQSGSKNAGFTNLLRSGNKPLAVGVLLLDLSRAYLVVWGCRYIPIDTLWPLVAVPLLLGNIWPVFHDFRGGKGIAMSIGIAFAVNPTAGAIALGAMILMISVWKKVSVGSLAFLICAASGFFAFESTIAGLLGVFMCVLGGCAHRENINRLVHGTEPSIFHSPPSK